MANKENLVGKKINLAKLTEELDKNNHKIKVRDFLNTFYVIMSELETDHPIVKGVTDKLGNEYNDFICSVVFALCMRLSQITLGEEAFYKMIARITDEEIELEADKSEMN